MLLTRDQRLFGVGPAFDPRTGTNFSATKKLSLLPFLIDNSKHVLRVVDWFALVLPVAGFLVGAVGGAAAPEGCWSRVRSPNQDRFFGNKEA